MSLTYNLLKLKKTINPVEDLYLTLYEGINKKNLLELYCKKN